MLEITKHKITTFMFVTHSGRTILVLIQFCSICHLKIEFSIGLDKLKNVLWCLLHTLNIDRIELLALTKKNILNNNNYFSICFSFTTLWMLPAALFLYYICALLALTDTML